MVEQRILVVEFRPCARSIHRALAKQHSVLIDNRACGGEVVHREIKVIWPMQVAVHYIIK